jgi:ribonuclease HI
MPRDGEQGSRFQTVALWQPVAQVHPGCRRPLGPLATGSKSKGELPVQIRYIRRDDVVVVELGSQQTNDAGEEISPGIHLQRDAEGRLARIEIHDAKAQIGADVLGPEDNATVAPVKRTRAASADTEEAPSGAGGASTRAVTIFSDGSCLSNPGPGGWAARLKYADGRIVEIAGGEPQTTNNRMEMTAAIKALAAVQDCPSITLVTDSEYLRKGITEWIHGWKRRGWMTAAKKPVLNKDLWQTLDQLNRSDIKWRYTRGHAGDPDNERCDELAQAYARGDTPPLQEG